MRPEAGVCGAGRGAGGGRAHGGPLRPPCPVSGGHALHLGVPGLDGRADAAARPVVDRDGRIEPHGLAACAQPPVELVVLVGEQRLVPAPRRIERIAAEEPGKDHVGGPFPPAHAIARIARAERGGGGERHGAPEPRGPDRIDPPAHVRRPGALERRDRAGEVARGQHRVRVAARDDRVARGAERAVETGGDRPFGIGDDAYAGEAAPHERPGRGRVGAVGNDHLDRARIVLGEHRFERGRDGRLGIARGHDERHGRSALGRRSRRPRAAVMRPRGHRPHRRARPHSRRARSRARSGVRGGRRSGRRARARAVCRAGAD